MRITTWSFGRITTQAVISGEPSCARTTSVLNGLKPTARQPVQAAELTIKERRFIFMASPLGRLRRGLRSGMDRRAYFLERAAAADVGDRGVDVRVGGLGLRREQRRGRHDHAG